MMTRRLTSSLVIAMLALSLTAATCNKNVPKQSTVINMKALVVSLGALQSGETTLFNSHRIEALTLDRHKAFNAKIVEITDAISAALDVIDAWKPGTPLPAQLGPILSKVKALLVLSADLVGAALPKEITDVWGSLTDITMVVGGIL